MLDEHNKLAEGFRFARDRLNLPHTDEFSLLLVSSKSSSVPFRDIVVETKQRFLKRVYETCKHFMQLQYPLFFPYGDDGFHVKFRYTVKRKMFHFILIVTIILTKQSIALLLLCENTMHTS